MSCVDAGVALAGESNVGLVRAGNEDNFCVISPRGGKPAFAAVSDGVGGSDNGALASYICCRDLASAFLASPQEALASPQAAAEFLLETVKRINARIFDRNLAYRSPRPMGTTLVALLLYPETAVLANVGDSRCYSWDREHGFRQRSVDHNLCNTMRDACRRFPGKLPLQLSNVVCRAVGPRADLEVDVDLLPRAPESRWLLCSDGVYREVDDGMLAKILSSGASPRQAVGEIMREVLIRGASDNLTAAVMYPAANGV